MPEKLIFTFPEQLAIPYPDPASFAMTYLFFGLAYFVSCRLTPFEPVKERGILDYTWILVVDLFFWPIVIVIGSYLMEKKLRKENLFEELVHEIEDW